MKRYTTIIKEYCNDFEHEIVGKLTRASEYEITKSDRCYVDDSLKNLYIVNARTHSVCVCTEDGCF